MAKRKKAKQYKILLSTILHFKDKILFSLGALLIVIALGYRADRSFTDYLLTRNNIEHSCKENQAAPASLHIPDVDVSAQVEESLVAENFWEISKDNVSHLKSSSIPGQNGNIVVYGHNTKNNFNALHDLKKGQSIVLTLKNGSRYAYVVQKIAVVFPNQVEMIRPTNEEVLTLYTCTGIADTMRLMIRAVPAKNSLAKNVEDACRS